MRFLCITADAQHPVAEELRRLLRQANIRLE